MNRSMTRATTRPRRRRIRAGRPVRGGFTIVEVVVAMMLLTIAAVGLSGYISYVAGVRFAAARSSMAGVVAGEAIERYRALPWDSLAVGVREAGVAAGGFQFAVRSLIEEPVPNLRVVTVSVRTPAHQEVRRFRTAVYKGRVR